MQLPFTAKFTIESKAYFHSFDQVNFPSVYKAAQTIVADNQFATIETEETGE